MACCRIAPPDLLARLLREGTHARQAAARRALAGTLPLRALRLDPALAPPPPATTAKRTVHDVYEGDEQPAHIDGYRDLPDDGDPANDNGGQDAVAQAWSAVGVTT